MYECFVNQYYFCSTSEKDMVVLLETKGDHLDAEKKIILGNLWESRAGSNYKYCLVYDKRRVEG